YSNEIPSIFAVFILASPFIERAEQSTLRWESSALRERGIVSPASDPQAAILERARDAVSRRAWVEAHELFAEAEGAGLIGPRDLPTVAEVAYAAGHLDVTIEAWERAHAEAARAGDDLGAAGAAVRVAMHLLFDTALMAPVRGWLSRAERLLAASPT